MSIDFQKIIYFKTVAENGTLVRASQMLHVSQPALSKSIAQVENEMGCRLFDRTGRSLTLNDAGRVLLEHANRALRELDSARSSITQLQDKADSTVRFTAYAPFGRPGYGAMLFKRMHPEIVVHYEYRNEGRPDTTCDLSLLSSNEPILNECSWHICEEEFVAALPHNHRLAKATEISLSELANDAFIMSITPVIRNAQMGMCREAGFEPQIFAEIQVYHDILGFVRSGLGVALVPRVSWLTGYENELAIVQIKRIRRTRHLYLQWPESRNPRYATQKFGKFIAAFLKGEACPSSQDDPQNHYEPAPS